MTKEELKLGQKVRDVITGFEGRAVGLVEYISGCTQVTIAPPVKEDNTLPEQQWFDIQRLEAVGNDFIALDNYLTPGFDKLPPKR